MTIYVMKITHIKTGRVTIGNVFTDKAWAEKTALNLKLQAPEWSWTLEERQLI